MKFCALASWFSTPVAKWGVVVVLAGAIVSAIAIAVLRSDSDPISPLSVITSP